MKRICQNILLGGALVFMTSCSTMNDAALALGEVPGEFVGAGLGAAVGAAVLDDPATGIALGALSGYSAVRYANKKKEEKQLNTYNSGYVKGRSDAAKTLYWAQRNAEREAEEGDLEYRYMEVPVAAHITSDGVQIDEHYRVIEVVE